MSAPLKFARIPDGGPLDFSPIPVSFTQDLHDTLGNYGDNSDGWEQLLSDMEIAIGPDGLGVEATNAIGDQITNSNFESFKSAWFDPVTSDLATQQETGDKLLAALNSDLNPPSNPPPTPPPAPPSNPPGGGGSGGGGGGGATSNECGWALGPDGSWQWTCIL